MEFLGFHYFCTVVQEGSISKAAERLFITQQSLSGYITRLEQKYNCILFERRPRLRLTLAGEQFYQFAKRVLEENTLVKEKISKNANCFVRLPIGISLNYEKYLIPKIWEAYHMEYPNVVLSMLYVIRAGQQLSLQNMDVYCSIVAFGQAFPKTRLEPLITNSFYALIPESYLQGGEHWEGTDTIPLSRLLHFPIILPPPHSKLRKVINEYCLDKGIALLVTIESTSPEACFEYYKKGLGCCMLPQLVLYNIIKDGSLPQGCRLLKIDLEDSSLEEDRTDIIYRTDISLPDYVEAFIRCAKNACRDYAAQIDSELRCFFAQKDTEA